MGISQPSSYNCTAFSILTVAFRTASFIGITQAHLGHNVPHGLSEASNPGYVM
ncbi:hypothetical protein BDZ94DRAFT_1268607 [Collybia nuda]|uniref:Uncharacterized protein n=1 Tax=Collybia nuda TaxID=64659 RepID=A0A9P5XYB6_9AGAR|nr:hypothetical protein BDZ94DRAFT_1268607 [Collybia nuda]